MKKLLIALAIPLLFTACFSEENLPEERGDAAEEVEVSEVEEKQVPEVEVSEPAANSNVTFPLLVTGQAKGGWYFEGSFNVKLLDGEGNVLDETFAQAQEDWMQEGFVPFEATIEPTTPPTEGEGKIVLSKDNPSGLPENDASVEVPVLFGE